VSVFLLSPASLHGRRGRRLLDPLEDGVWSRRLRAGVPVGELFAHVSALYFRGKLAYALRFGGAGSTRVIAPGFGLVAPDWRVDAAAARRLAEVPVDPDEPGYRAPLERAVRRLARSGRAPYVLLGSLATERYVSVLAPILGDQLVVPAELFGLGNMQRGSLLLRAAAAGKELQYVAWAQRGTLGRAQRGR
jgi:hypothetical protein